MASVPSPALGEMDWLREVLSGLMDNAVRFADSGEVVASITADPTGGARLLFTPRCRHQPRHVTGRSRRLFGPRDGRSRFTPLTGVGETGTLPVAQRLVELMDGRLGWGSALGMGTTSWFTVPLDLP